MFLFTRKEWIYLDKLEKRNHDVFLQWISGEENTVELWDPLEKPMSVEERKIRSSIRRKMTLNAKELAYAFQCGMPPEKWLFDIRVIEYERVCWLFKGLAWIDFLERREDLKEIVGTKHVKFDSTYEFGSAGDLISKEAQKLRGRFRERNPEIYDEIEKKLDAEYILAQSTRFQVA